MATIASTAKVISACGSVVFWTAKRILRESLKEAFDAVNHDTIPAIDHYDCLVETAKRVVDIASIGGRKTPVKYDSLSRTGVGVEAYQLTKGDSRNQREFLFSLGVDTENKVFVITHSQTSALAGFFANPQHIDVLNALYQTNLRYMAAKDVTEAIAGLVTRNLGVPMNGSGAPYFVPESSIPVIDSVFSDLNSCGCRCTMVQADPGDEVFAQQVLEATVERISSQTGQIVQDMQELLQPGPDGRPRMPRQNGMESRAKELSHLIRLCDTFEGLFGSGLEQCKEALGHAAEMLSELHIRKQAAKKR